MHKEIKEEITYAERLGFKNEGYDGRGHYRLVHEGEGQAVHIAATPSDYRNRQNVRAVLRRIAGVSSDSPNARKSRKAFRPSGFAMTRTSAELEASQVYEQLLAEHEEIECEIQAIAATATSRYLREQSKPRLLQLIGKRDRCREQIEGLYKPLPTSQLPKPVQPRDNWKDGGE